jgi:hypothetical protein
MRKGKQPGDEALDWTLTWMEMRKRRDSRSPFMMAVCRKFFPLCIYI